MINNLFSVFDPRSTFLSLSWGIPALTLTLMRKKIWLAKRNWRKLISAITINFKKEVKFSIVKTEKGTELMVITLFLMIILLNFSALYPQNFSVTSHLSFTMPLSLSMWITVVIFGWYNKTNHMLSHLLPQGTPSALIAFMVLIELTRNLIRPITLCVRLTANLIAGHLLITLLGNLIIRINIQVSIIIIVSPLILSILESAVACIQAYVFMTLITLYTTEIK